MSIPCGTFNQVGFINVHNIVILGGHLSENYLQHNVLNFKVVMWTIVYHITINRILVLVTSNMTSSNSGLKQ